MYREGIRPAPALVVASWLWTIVPRFASSWFRGEPTSPHGRPGCLTSAAVGGGDVTRRGRRARRSQHRARLQARRGAIAGMSGPAWMGGPAGERNDAERAHLFHPADAADGTSAGTPPATIVATATLAAKPGICSVHRTGDHSQRPDGLPRRWPPRRRCTPRCTQLVRVAPWSLPGSPSPAHQLSPRLLSRLGPRRRHVRSQPRGPKPAATPTTKTFTTWSANCPPAATSSADAGRSQRPLPRRGHQTLPPPRRRRRPRTRLRKPRHDLLSRMLTLTLYAAEPVSTHSTSALLPRLLDSRP